MTYVFAIMIAVAVVALCLTLPLRRRHARLAEVDRFHLARSLTTTWASSPQPEVVVPAQGDDYTP